LITGVSDGMESPEGAINRAPRVFYISGGFVLFYRSNFKTKVFFNMKWGEGKYHQRNPLFFILVRKCDYEADED
jgi:hypothetical protein